MSDRIIGTEDDVLTKSNRNLKEEIKNRSIEIQKSINESATEAFDNDPNVQRAREIINLQRSITNDTEYRLKNTPNPYRDNLSELDQLLLSPRKLQGVIKNSPGSLLGMLNNEQNREINADIYEVNKASNLKKLQLQNLQLDQNEEEINSKQKEFAESAVKRVLQSELDRSALAVGSQHAPNTDTNFVDYSIMANLKSGMAHFVGDTAKKASAAGTLLGEGLEAWGRYFANDNLTLGGALRQAQETTRKINERKGGTLTSKLGDYFNELGESYNAQPALTGEGLAQTWANPYGNLSLWDKIKATGSYAKHGLMPNLAASAGEMVGTALMMTPMGAAKGLAAKAALGAAGLTAEAGRFSVRTIKEKNQNQGKSNKGLINTDEFLSGMPAGYAYGAGNFLELGLVGKGAKAMLGKAPKIKVIGADDLAKTASNTANQAPKGLTGKLAQQYRNLAKTAPFKVGKEAGKGLGIIGGAAGLEYGVERFQTGLELGITNPELTKAQRDKLTHEAGMVGVMMGGALGALSPAVKTVGAGISVVRDKHDNSTTKQQARKQSVDGYSKFFDSNGNLNLNINEDEFMQWVKNTIDPKLKMSKGGKDLSDIYDKAMSVYEKDLKEFDEIKDLNARAKYLEDISIQDDKKYKRILRYNSLDEENLASIITADKNIREYINDNSSNRFDDIKAIKNIKDEVSSIKEFMDFLDDTSITDENKESIFNLFPGTKSLDTAVKKGNTNAFLNYVLYPIVHKNDKNKKQLSSLNFGLDKSTLLNIYNSSFTKDSNGNMVFDAKLFKKNLPKASSTQQTQSTGQQQANYNNTYNSSINDKDSDFDTSNMDNSSADFSVYDEKGQNITYKDDVAYNNAKIKINNKKDISLDSIDTDEKLDYVKELLKIKEYESDRGMGKISDTSPIISTTRRILSKLENDEKSVTKQEKKVLELINRSSIAYDILNNSAGMEFSVNIGTNNSQNNKGSSLNVKNSQTKTNYQVIADNAKNILGGSLGETFANKLLTSRALSAILSNISSRQGRKNNHAMVDADLLVTLEGIMRDAQIMDSSYINGTMSHEVYSENKTRLQARVDKLKEDNETRLNAFRQIRKIAESDKTSTKESHIFGVYSGDANKGNIILIDETRDDYNIAELNDIAKILKGPIEEDKFKQIDNWNSNQKHTYKIIYAVRGSQDTKINDTLESIILNSLEAINNVDKFINSKEATENKEYIRTNIEGIGGNSTKNKKIKEELENSKKTLLKDVSKKVQDFNKELDNIKQSIKNLNSVKDKTIKEYQEYISLVKQREEIENSLSNLYREYYQLLVKSKPLIDENSIDINRDGIKILQDMAILEEFYETQLKNKGFLTKLVANLSNSKNSVVRYLGRALAKLNSTVATYYKIVEKLNKEIKEYESTHKVSFEENVLGLKNSDRLFTRDKYKIATLSQEASKALRNFKSLYAIDENLNNLSKYKINDTKLGEFVMEAEKVLTYNLGFLENYNINAWNSELHNYIDNPVTTLPKVGDFDFEKFSNILDNNQINYSQVNFAKHSFLDMFRDSNGGLVLAEPMKAVLYLAFIGAIYDTKMSDVKLNKEEGRSSAKVQSTIFASSLSSRFLDILNARPANNVKLNEENQNKAALGELLNSLVTKVSENDAFQKNFLILDDNSKISNNFDTSMKLSDKALENIDEIMQTLSNKGIVEPLSPDQQTIFHIAMEWNNDKIQNSFAKNTRTREEQLAYRINITTTHRANEEVINSLINVFDTKPKEVVEEIVNSIFPKASTTARYDHKLYDYYKDKDGKHILVRTPMLDQTINSIIVHLLKNNVKDARQIVKEAIEKKFTLKEISNVEDSYQEALCIISDRFAKTLSDTYEPYEYAKAIGTNPVNFNISTAINRRNSYTFTKFNPQSNKHIRYMFSELTDDEVKDNKNIPKYDTQTLKRAIVQGLELKDLSKVEGDSVNAVTDKTFTEYLKSIQEELTSLDIPLNIVAYRVSSKNNDINSMQTIRFLQAIGKENIKNIFEGKDLDFSKIDIKQLPILSTDIQTAAPALRSVTEAITKITLKLAHNSGGFLASKDEIKSNAKEDNYIAAGLNLFDKLLDSNEIVGTKVGDVYVSFLDTKPTDKITYKELKQQILNNMTRKSKSSRDIRLYKFSKYILNNLIDESLSKDTIPNDKTIREILHDELLSSIRNYSKPVLQVFFYGSSDRENANSFAYGFIENQLLEVVGRYEVEYKKNISDDSYIKDMNKVIKYLDNKYLEYSIDEKANILKGILKNAPENSSQIESKFEEVVRDIDFFHNGLAIENIADYNKVFEKEVHETIRQNLGAMFKNSIEEALHELAPGQTEINSTLSLTASLWLNKLAEKMRSILDDMPMKYKLDIEVDDKGSVIIKADSIPRHELLKAYYQAVEESKEYSSMLVGPNIDPESVKKVFTEIFTRVVDPDKKASKYLSKFIPLAKNEGIKEGTKISPLEINLTDIGAAFLTNAGQSLDARIQTYLTLNSGGKVFLNLFDAIYTNLINAKELETLMNEAYVKSLIDLDKNSVYNMFTNMYKNIDSYFNRPANQTNINEEKILNGLTPQDLKTKLATIIDIMEYMNNDLRSKDTYTNVVNSNVFLDSNNITQTSYINKADKSVVANTTIKETVKNLPNYYTVAHTLGLDIKRATINTEKGLNQFVASVNGFLDRVHTTLDKLSTYTKDNKDGIDAMIEGSLGITLDSLKSRLTIDDSASRSNLNPSDKFFENANNVKILENVTNLIKKGRNLIIDDKVNVFQTIFEKDSATSVMEEYLKEFGSFTDKEANTSVFKSLATLLVKHADKIDIFNKSIVTRDSKLADINNRSKVVMNTASYDKNISTTDETNLDSKLNYNIDRISAKHKLDSKILEGYRDLIKRAIINKNSVFTLNKDDIVFLAITKDTLFELDKTEEIDTIRASLENVAKQYYGKTVIDQGLKTYQDFLEEALTILPNTIYPENLERLIEDIIVDRRATNYKTKEITYPNHSRDIASDPLSKEVEEKLVNEAIKNSQATTSNATRQINSIDSKEYSLSDDMQNIMKVFEEVMEFDKQRKDNRVFNDDMVGFWKNNISMFIDRADPFFRSQLKVIIHKAVQTKDLEGEYDSKGNKISLFLNPKNKNNMTATEIYVHELMHAISEYVVSSNDPKFKPLKDELVSLQKKFLQHVNNDKKLRVQLMNDLGLNTLDELDTYFLDYMKDPSEFLAIMMSNKHINDLAKTISVYDGVTKENLTLVDKIVNLFKKIINELFNLNLDIKGATVDEAMVNLVLQIGVANNNLYNAYKQAKITGVIAKTFDTLDKVTGAIVKPLGEISAKHVDRLLDKTIETNNKWLGIWLFIRIAPHIGNKNHHLHQKMNRVITQVLNRKADGFWAQFYSSWTRDDFGKTLGKKFKALSDIIDKERNTNELAIKKELRDMFSRELSRDEQELLTTVIKKTDLTVFKDYYELDDIYDMFFRDGYAHMQGNIDEEIRKLNLQLTSEVIGSGKNQGSYLSDIYRNIDTLAHYMATGEVKGYLLSNAVNIAKDLRTKKKGTSYKENDLKVKIESIVPLIDKIITLKSMKYLTKEDVDSFSNLYSDQRDGLNKLYDYIANVNNANKVAMFTAEGDVTSNYQKGYVRYSTNESVDLQLGTLKDRKKMEDLGYEMVSSYDYGDNKGTPNQMVVYLNKYYFKQGFTRGALRTTNTNSRGFSVSSHIKAVYPDLNDLDLENMLKGVVANISSKYAAEESRAWSERKLMPIFNSNGDIVDFKYILDEKVKAALETTNISIFDAVANETSRVFDNVKSTEHNINFVREWDMYYEQNKNNPNLEWIEINASSLDERYKEVWDMLPKSTKDYINDPVRGSNVGRLFIRGDIFTNMTGHKDLRLTETKFFDKWIKNGKIKKVARWVEGLAMKHAGIVRENIVLKNPAVLIDNMISNFSVLMNYNITPDRAIRDFAEGVKYLNRYNELIMEKLKYERIQKDPLLSLNKQNEAKRRLDKINTEIEDNPMYLFDRKGLISNIVNESGFKDETKYADFVDKNIELILGKLPPQAKGIIDNLLVRENTSHHQFLSMLTQYSDLLSRYSLWKNQKDKMSSEDLFGLLDRSFINYSTLDHEILKYINDIGLWRFTKYFVRTQQYIMHDMLGKKLGRTAAMHGVATMLGFNLPSPLASIFVGRLFKLKYMINIPFYDDFQTLFGDGYGDIIAINNQLEYVGAKFF